MIVQRQWERMVRLLQQRSAQTKYDEPLRKNVSRCESAREQADLLTQYFWQNHEHYLSYSKIRAYYPGLPSMHGSAADGVEGVTRLLPLWAMYINSPQTKANHTEKMQQHLTRCFIKGTDHTYSFYWGNAGDYSQLICEAADVALALWLSRDLIYQNLSDSQQQQIINWLMSFLDKKVMDNNWHLFVILIDAVISALVPKHQFRSQHRLKRIQSFYMANGAFKDGEKGEIDFYNAWGFHYSIFWINKIWPTSDSAGLQSHLLEFCQWYQYFFTKKGFVLFGRSLCYRFAVAAPLLAAASIENSVVNKDVAASINFYTWRFLVQNKGISKGRPNQGVFSDDERLLDSYSGPSSAFWGTRSLVMFYWLVFQTQQSDFTLEPLPSEKKVEHKLPKIGLFIATDPKKNEVEVTKSSSAQLPDNADYYNCTWKNKIREILYAIPFRAKPKTQTIDGKYSANLLAQYHAVKLKGY